jgi:hypothetical protein
MPVRPLLYAALVIAGAALTAAYAVLGFWSWAVAMAVLALLWLVGLWRSQPFLRGLGTWGLLAGLVVGAGSGLPVLLLLLAALGFLAAWDLTRLVERMQLVRDPAVALMYAGQHLKVLGLVLAAGLVLGLAAFNVELQIRFGWLVGLVVLVLILVRLAISLLQRWE